MIEGPKLIERPAQPYVGIRTQVTMSEFGSGIIPKLHDEVMGWLKQKGLNPSGAPMIIYHVIDMANKLDVEMAWPVAAAQTDDGRIHAGPLPAGRYASLLYTGDYSGLMDANRVLIEWAQQNNIAWDRWDDPNGDAFAARYESYITDPGEEPDASKWQTEVAIRIADK
jgi:effector-binding domain-containing protein